MKKIIALVTFVISTLFMAQVSHANEGIIQMNAQDGTAGACEVYSILLDNFQYKMLVNCRNLKYPISKDLFQYAMWADHGGEEGVTFLGTLGIGKREFVTDKPFNRLFVTKEGVRDPQTPSNFSFMSGPVLGSDFLDKSGPEITSPQATPVVEAQQPTQNTQTNGTSALTSNQAADEEASPGIGNAIRILGAVVAFIVVIVIIIAFVSASRRRPVSI